MEKFRIYNLIILDASGSMDSIYNQALSGTNETIQSIRKAQEDHPELEQYLTFVSFSSGENYLHKLYYATPIDAVREMTKEDYIASGCTALYDAMGTMISEMQGVVRHGDRVLVTVITDGYENSSRKWDGHQIKALVSELRQMGWTFTYIGANQDVDKVAGEMGIKNTLSFSANAAGTATMFRKSNACRERFYDACIESPCEEESENFFDQYR